MVAPHGTLRDEDIICPECTKCFVSRRDSDANNWKCARCGLVRDSDAADLAWLVVAWVGLAACALLFFWLYYYNP